MKNQIREEVRLLLEAKRCEDAIAAAEIRAELARSGTPIGALDTLIAGQTAARDLTLVTSNVRHFGRVAGLRLIDWAVGPERLTSDQVADRLTDQGRHD